MLHRIEKSAGLTATERHLAELGEKSFLNLWSYPNVHRDQGKNQLGVGHEMCDLLVVCGNHVLIFSEKFIKYKESGDLNIDWSRWFKRAVIGAAKQLYGAERWLDWPERLFLDPKCDRPFPLELPSKPTRKTHLIAVSRGSAEACRKHFGGGSGSLMVNPSLSAEDSTDPKSANFKPFTVGDLYPLKSFVHVFDDTTLNILLMELDTITDFVQYLERKEKFVRSGHLLHAAGEEELLSYYIKRMGPDGVHDFTPPEGPSWQGQFLVLDEGPWEETLQNTQYISKKTADQPSYLWDELIKRFTNHMLDGTTMTLGEDFSIDSEASFDIKYHEQAVRYMALETRFRRRILSNHISHAIQNAKPSMRMARIIPPAPELLSSTGYLFLQFPRNLHASYSDYSLYRQHRAKMLYAYCAVVRSLNESWHRIVGIGMEPPKFSENQSVSEDLVLVEIPEMTEEFKAHAEELRKNLSILNAETTRQGFFSAREYPDESRQGRRRREREEQKRRNK